ncbi:hypothetical protein GOODEAATRI_000282 [Goodea atripinnis]|uniref:Titin n=1 Tax=Goodea atripinnis TaxID=208336 RepID=A0ABV0NJP5_9TELE
MGKTSEAMLTVLEGDLYFTVKLQNYTAVEKDEAVLSCELSKAAAEVKWFRDGNEIFSSKNVLFQSDGRKRMLVIRKTAKRDRGAYTCDCGTDKTTADLNIEEPPVEFTKPLEDQTVEEESTATLECEVSRENAEVQWFRDDQEIRKTKKYEILVDGCKRTLLIHECTLDDSKTYTCDAKDFKTSCFLSVEASQNHPLPSLQITWFKDGNEIRKGKKYEIIAQGRQHILIIHKAAFDDEAEYECNAKTSKSSGMLTVVETDSVKLICEVSKPTADVTWYKGEVELPEGGRYEHIVDGKKRILLIKDLKIDDAGVYTCRLSPTVGTSGNLKINELAAEFLSRPQNQEVVEGQKAEFTCSVSKETFSVKWVKDDKELESGDKYEMVSDGKRRTLIIKDCEPKDEGGYVVMIGETRAGADLTVNEESLRIVVPPEDIDTQEKKTISFSCKTNRPNATVKWMKAGEEITFSKRIVYRVDKEKHVLTIKDCTLADEGEYTVVAGQDKATAELIISEAPTDFSAQLKDQTITEFDDAEFMCKLTKEKAEVKWYRNGREIREGPRYTFVRDGKFCTLRIKECRPDDECEYACGVDEKRSRARLFIPVEIVRPPQDVFEPPGSDVVFEVELNKDRLEVKWLRNNMTVVQGDKFQMMSEGKLHRLQVCEIRPRDQGLYRVIIKTTDQSYVTDAGKPIVMAIPYTAYPQAEADWLYNNLSLPKDNIHTSADRTEYWLKDPKKSDQGRYKIIIKNKHGEGEAFINLDVIDVPGPVKNLQVVDTADGEVSLVWEEPENDGGSKVVGYVVERRDVKRKTWTLATDHTESPEYTVTGLQKDAFYLFRVSARNRVGSGPFVETDEAVQAKNKFGRRKHFWVFLDVPEAPLNIIVGNVTKFGCTVSWDPPVSDGGSPITSYIVELRDRTSVKWSPVQVTKADELSAIINDVIENKEYIFRVKAENKAGEGKPSAASQPVKIMDPIGED